MARIVKPLNDTQLKNAKAKEKDYKLSDGEGLYFVVKKMEQNHGDMTSLMVEKENLCLLVFIPLYL